MIVNRATPGLRRPVQAPSPWNLSLDQMRERMLEHSSERGSLLAGAALRGFLSPRDLEQAGISQRSYGYDYGKVARVAHGFHAEEMAALSPDLAKGDMSRAALHPTIWDYIKDSDKGSYSTQEGE